MVSARRRRTTEPKPSPAADMSTRTDALRYFAAEVSGSQDLAGLFREVIDESFTLFGVDEAGLWTYDDSPTPLKLASQRGLSREALEIIATLPQRSGSATRAASDGAGPVVAAQPRRRATPRASSPRVSPKAVA